MSEAINDEAPRPRQYDPEQLAQGHHTRADLTWYGGALARLDRGVEGAPRAPASVLGQLGGDESRVTSDSGWLSPGAMRLDEDRRRSDAIERTLSRVLRRDVQWYRLLSEVWVRRAGRAGASVDPFYLDVGLVCCMPLQRAMWTSRKGEVRTAMVIAWARRELSRASEAYDHEREPACDG